MRHGIDNPSEEYLAMYAKDGEIPFCSAELIMKAVAEIEKMIKENIYVTKSLWYKEDKVYKSFYDKMIKKEKPSKQRKSKF